MPAPHPALSGLLSFAFSLVTFLSVVGNKPLWVSCLSFPLSRPPLPPQEASPSLELRQKERVEKSFTLFELSLPFPGLLTPISSSSLLLAGSLGIFPNILTSILSCHLEAGAALLQGSDRSSFSFSSEGFCCYLFHLFNPLCRLYSFCLRVARQNWLHQAS